jgi:16S rRNA processing protein RimM
MDDSYIKVGWIQRAHGFQGKVVAWLDCPLNVGEVQLKNIFIQLGHTLVPYQVTYWESLPNKVILALQGVQDRTEAYRLKGKLVFVSKANLLGKAMEEHLKLLWIGYRVVDTQQSDLGTVIRVEQFPSQRMLVVAYLDKELMIPMHEDLVSNIDHVNKQISVNLPPGFIEAVV